MKKILIIIIYCSLLITHCMSQSITWQRVYDCNLAKATARDLCEADGNNFYISGPAGHGQVYMIVVKVNQWGDTIWTNNYGGGRIYAITSSGDGGCVFTGDIGPSYAYKIKSTGDTAWLRYYNGRECFDIKKTTDGGYIMCGNYANGFNLEGYVCKIDSIGNLQWERTYPDGLYVNFESLDYAIEGNGYVISGTYESLAGPDICYFLKISDTGVIVWQKYYSLGINSGLRSFAKCNNGYILTGNTYIYLHLDSLRVFTIKVDNNGTLISSKIYESNFRQTLPSIITDNSNKFYISFWTDTVNYRRSGSKIISIDSNLKIIKELTLLPDTNGLELFTLFKISNSTDIMGCGRTDQFEIYGNTQMFALRLDSSLNPPPPIGIKVISNNVPGKYKLYQNFPNPFNSTTVIKFYIPFKTAITIKLYDLLGREIETIADGNYEHGIHQINYNSKYLSSGVYFYGIETKNLIDTKKMVLIK